MGVGYTCPGMCSDHPLLGWPGMDRVRGLGSPRAGLGRPFQKEKTPS